MKSIIVFINKATSRFTSVILNSNTNGFELDFNIKSDLKTFDLINFLISFGILIGMILEIVYDIKFAFKYLDTCFTTISFGFLIINLINAILHLSFFNNMINKIYSGRYIHLHTKYSCRKFSNFWKNIQSYKNDHNTSNIANENTIMNNNEKILKVLITESFCIPFNQIKSYYLKYYNNFSVSDLLINGRIYNSMLDLLNKDIKYWNYLRYYIMKLIIHISLLIGIINSILGIYLTIVNNNIGKYTLYVAFIIVIISLYIIYYEMLKKRRITLSRISYLQECKYFDIKILDLPLR